MAFGRSETTGQVLAEKFVAKDTGEDDALIETILEENPTPVLAEETPAAPQEEIYVVKEGDTLNKISQDLGIPLDQLARQNEIKDVNLIIPGQEIKYTSSAAPGEGMQIGDETITMQPGGTTEEGVLGGEPEIEGEEPGFAPDREFEDISDVGTPTEAVGGLDFEAQEAIAKKPPGPDIDAGKVTEKELTTATLPKATTVDFTEEVTPEYIMRIASETFKPEDPNVKSAWEEYKTQIADIKFGDEGELRTLLEKQQKELTDEIASYQGKIDAVAAEEFTPTFTGWNKFMAILGASLGSYAAAMTGSPNFALNILNDAIDRDQQDFLKSKEIRVRTLEQQRLALRERRGQLLTMAERAVDRIQQNAQFKLTAAASQAQIRQTAEQIANAKEENFRNYLGDLATILVNEAKTTATLDRALDKDERERKVEGIALINAEGEKVELPAFFAKTKEQQIKLTKFMEQTDEISNEIQQMKKLFDDPNKWLPAIFSETKKQLDIHHNNIMLKVKFINNMGANFTVSEQAMIKAVIPTVDIPGRLSTARIAAEQMDRKLLDGVTNVMKRHGAIPISTESLFRVGTNRKTKIPTVKKVATMSNK